MQSYVTAKIEQKRKNGYDAISYRPTMCNKCGGQMVPEYKHPKGSPDGRNNQMCLKCDRIIGTLFTVNNKMAYLRSLQQFRPKTAIYQLVCRNCGYRDTRKAVGKPVSWFLDRANACCRGCGGTFVEYHDEPGIEQRLADSKTRVGE